MSAGPPTPSHNGLPALDTASLQSFETPDAILGDDIEPLLRRHHRQHGSVRDAAAALTDRYDGVPDMIRLLVDWSNLYTDGTRNLQEAVRSILLEHEQTIIPRLDDALAVSSDALPVIRAITASDVWGGVVGAMAARRTESTLHNVLTREARLAEAGIGQEVLESPTSFVEAVVQQLRRVFDAGAAGGVGEEQLLALYKSVGALCTYDECTTIVALRLFHMLSRRAEDPLMRGLYRRVGQEVRAEAVRVMTAAGIVDEQVARQYVVRLAVLTDAVASGVHVRKPVLDALLGLLGGDKSGKRKFEGEIKVLKNTYERLIGNIEIEYGGGDVVETVTEVKWGVEEKAVLIRMLCHVEVFDDLVSTLFSHEKRTYLDGKPDVGKRQCLCLLLAYAGVFVCLDEREVPGMLGNKEVKKRLRREIKEVYEKVLRVAEVCEDLKPGCPRFKIKGKAVETLLNGTNDPLVARGIFLWAKEGLHGGPDPRALMVTAVKHLAFMEALVEKHPILRSQVLEAIQVAFLRDYPGLDITQTEELRDKFMKTITDMVKVQMGPLIVEVFLKSWVDNDKVDKAHLRRFVSRLLQIISPPYSPSFAASVVELLDNKRVTSSIDKEKDVQKKVAEFRSQVAAMGIV